MLKFFSILTGTLLYNKKANHMLCNKIVRTKNDGGCKTNALFIGEQI